MAEKLENTTKATNLGIAFIAKNDTNTILCCTSGDGAHWSANVRAGQDSSEAPAVALFLGRFWTAFVSDDKHDQLLVCSSPDGVTWSPNSQIQQRSEVAPSLCVFDKRLYIAFIADDDSRNILVCSTADGVTWTNHVKVGQTSDFAPSLCAYKDRLWLAFVAKNSTRNILVCSSSDGERWSGNSQIGQTTRQAPSLCAFKGRLRLAFVANDSSERLLICSSDGGKWTDNSPMGQSSEFAPSLAAVGDKLYVAFASNNSAQEILLCSSSDGTAWSGNQKVGQTTKRAPTLFVQDLTIGTVRPKYQVLTVVYAPPGTAGGNSSSSVVYTDSSSAGTTSSITDSVGKSVSVVAKVGNDVASAGGNFSTSNTTSDTETIDITKRDSYSITVQGPAVDGIDHDRDMFYLCLNPLFKLAVDQVNTTIWTPGVDGTSMNVQYVYAGWLKNPGQMPASVKKALDAAGLTAADYAAILAHNPYASGGAIDPDRYMSTGQCFPYIPPYDAASAPAIETYQHENTIDRSQSRTVEVQYSVSATVTAGMPNIWSVETTTSLTMTNSNTFGTSSSKTQAATVTIGGPAYGYDGPVDVQVYWDTVYNTFMFAFPEQAPDVSGAATTTAGKAVAGAPVTLRVGDRTLRTYTDARGEYRFYDVPAGQAKITVEGAGARATSKSAKNGLSVS